MELPSFVTFFYRDCNAETKCVSSLILKISIKLPSSNHMTLRLRLRRHKLFSRCCPAKLIIWYKWLVPRRGEALCFHPSWRWFRNCNAISDDSLNNISIFKPINLYQQKGSSSTGIGLEESNPEKRVMILIRPNRIKKTRTKIFSIFFQYFTKSITRNSSNRNYS